MRPKTAIVIWKTKEVAQCQNNQVLNFPIRILSLDVLEDLFFNQDFVILQIFQTEQTVNRKISGFRAAHMNKSNKIHESCCFYLHNVSWVVEFKRCWVLKSQCQTLTFKVNLLRQKLKEFFDFFWFQNIHLENFLLQILSPIFLNCYSTHKIHTIIFYKYIDFWPKTLLFRIHLLGNSTTEMTLQYTYLKLSDA